MLTQADRATVCEHMRALVEYCREHQVFFGGCGECGSAWLTCHICKVTVQEAHELFTEEEYSEYR